MVDEVRGKVERTASGQGNGEVGRRRSRGKGVDDWGRSRIAEEEFSSGEGTNMVAAETASERKAESGREARS
jgi:hypothetical protein